MAAHVIFFSFSQRKSPNVCWRRARQENETEKVTICHCDRSRRRNDGGQSLRGEVESVKNVRLPADLRVRANHAAAGTGRCSHSRDRGRVLRAAIGVLLRGFS